MEQFLFYGFNPSGELRAKAERILDKAEKSLMRKLDKWRSIRFVPSEKKRTAPTESFSRN